MNLKTKLKVLKALNDIFVSPDTKYQISEDEYNKLKTACVMDPANVCQIESKSKLGKSLLKDFVMNDNEIKPVKLDYEAQKNDLVSSSTYSLDYLNKIINIFYLFKADVPRIKISVKNDYPMTLENDDIKIILAPRVDND